jgi:DNA-directed RNA polymerase subunit RPC12/RpoP
MFELTTSSSGRTAADREELLVAVERYECDDCGSHVLTVVGYRVKGRCATCGGSALRRISAG